jgi:hypothetical protein
MRGMTAIDKLRQDAAGLLPQGERAIYNRTQLEAILAEVDALVRERDEARREVCRDEACRPSPSPPCTANQVAARRGWDCFKENNDE